MTLTMMLSPDFNLEQSLAIQTITSATATDGTGVDVSKYRNLDLVVHVSAPLSTTDDTVTFTVEHSYDNTTFVAVTAADLVDRDGNASTFTVGTDAVAVDEILFLRRTGNLRRYVRVVATTTGAAAVSISFGAWIGGLYQLTEEGS